MWKAIGIGCAVLVALGVAAVVAVVLLVPRLIDTVQKHVAEEQDRQALAAAWDAPDRDAAPARVFPVIVQDYRLARTDDWTTVPELTLDAKGAHAVYGFGVEKMDVYAYPVTKREAEALMLRAQRLYEQGVNENGTRRWEKIDLGDTYARVRLVTPRLGQNHLWYTKGWLLVFRTRDTADREGFVRAFLQAAWPRDWLGP